MISRMSRASRNDDWHTTVQWPQSVQLTIRTDGRSFLHVVSLEVVIVACRNVHAGEGVRVCKILAATERVKQPEGSKKSKLKMARKHLETTKKQLKVDPPLQNEVLLALLLKAEILSDVRVHDAFEQLVRTGELIALYEAVGVVDQAAADRVRIAQHQAELQLVAGDQRGSLGL